MTDQIVHNDELGYRLSFLFKQSLWDYLEIWILLEDSLGDWVRCSVLDSLGGTLEDSLEQIKFKLTGENK